MENYNLRIRGQDGRFVGVDSLVASLRGKNYTLVVEDSVADIVYFEHPEGDSEDLAEDFKHIGRMDLKGKLTTLFCPNGRSKRDKRAENVVYFVEAAA